MPKITIDQQISEVQREIAMRARVYPSFVTRKKMRQGEADEHMARMEAVLQTLQWLQANEAVIKGKAEANGG